MSIMQNIQATFSLPPIGKPIVLPPNTKTFVLFGTGGDGNEGNRAPGGPALTVSSGTPVHAVNFVSLGQQPFPSPTRNDVIDTGNANDVTNWPLGFTWCCVARNPNVGNGNYVAAMATQTAVSGQGINMDTLALQNSTNRVVNYSGIGSRGTIQLTTPAYPNWHFIALTDTGGAAPTVQVYEFTDIPSGQSAATPYLPTGRVSNAAMTAHFGCLSVEAAVSLGPIDIAFGFVCTGVMTQANMAALATAVRPILARRGVVM